MGHYVTATTGSVELAGRELQAGDGASFDAGDVASLTMKQAGELLLFDLA